VVPTIPGCSLGRRSGRLCHGDGGRRAARPQLEAGSSVAGGAEEGVLGLDLEAEVDCPFRLQVVAGPRCQL